jgi:hypothetical protein
MISVCPQHETDTPTYMACSKSGICSSGLSSKQTAHKNMPEKLPMCRPIKLVWKIQDKEIVAKSSGPAARNENSNSTLPLSAATAVTSDV